MSEVRFTDLIVNSVIKSFAENNLAGDEYKWEIQIDIPAGQVHLMLLLKGAVLGQAHVTVLTLQPLAAITNQVVSDAVKQGMSQVLAERSASLSQLN